LEVSREGGGRRENFTLDFSSDQFAFAFGIVNDLLPFFRPI